MSEAEMYPDHHQCKCMGDGVIRHCHCDPEIHKVMIKVYKKGRKIK